MSFVKPFLEIFFYNPLSLGIEPAMLRATTLLIGLVLGTSIWLVSPMVTGAREPWDARSMYFVVALLASGIVVGLVGRAQFWVGLVGLYVGQLTVMLLRPQQGMEQAPWWAGALMLALFTAVALVAAALTVLLRRLRRSPG